LEAGQALDDQSRPRLPAKKGKIERLTARALADPTWGVEFLDESWFVWVPEAGVMNPEAGYGWGSCGEPLKNRATRKKGQQTWSCYLALDAKEERVAWRYSQHTTRWQTAIFVNERLKAHERQGHRVMLLIWDNASWHVARDLKGWFQAHNRQVDRQRFGTKIVPVCTPVHAFWLNRCEPLFGHAKGRVLPCRQFASPTEQQTALDRHWLHRNLRRARVPSLEDLIPVLH
jgi:hypothetical protein